MKFRTRSTSSAERRTLGPASWLTAAMTLGHIRKPGWELIVQALSRYVVISENSYTNSNGQAVRLVYGTRCSKVVPIDHDAVIALQAGRLDALNPATLRLLNEAEIVVDSARDELVDVTSRNKVACASQSEVHVGLLPTSFCNMGCSYCGQEHSQGRLSQDHRDAARERVVGLIQRPETTRLRLDWFGAEPLIGLPVILYLSRTFTQVADDCGVDYFAATATNGTLLTVETAIKLHQTARLRHCEVTLDGPPEVHDSHRPLKKPGGSFWTIVNAIAACLAEPRLAGLYFRIRSNIDARNQPHMLAFYELMASLGFAHPHVEFAMHPVHSWGNDISTYAVQAADYAEAELVLLRRMLDLGLRVGLLPTAPTTVLCPAVTQSAEIISSTGRVFSCSEQPLVPQAERVGSVATLGELVLRSRSEHRAVARPFGAFDEWNSEVETGLALCSRCTYFPTCGGACPKAWHEGNPPCPSYKRNVQGRLDLIAGRHGLQVRAHD